MKFLSLFILLFLGCSGDISELGVINGNFKPCPITPNAVSTMADPGSDFHYIAPLMYKMNKDEALTKIKGILQDYNDEEVKILTLKDDYIHAEFTSRFFKFTSDVEIFFPVNGSYIHIRSASRVGIGDFGRNRIRVENIRTLLLK